MKKRCRIILSLISMLLLGSIFMLDTYAVDTKAEGVVYLDTNSATNGDGSIATPYNQVQAAIDHFGGGDGTILLQSQMNVNEDLTLNTQPSQEIIIKRNFDGFNPMFIVSDNKSMILNQIILDNNAKSTSIVTAKGINSKVIINDGAVLQNSRHTLVLIGNTSTLEMYGGELRNMVNNASSAISIQGQGNGVMNGGSIHDNDCSAITLEAGSGRFEMNGGKIYNNSTMNKTGFDVKAGAVFVASKNSAFIMNGGEIYNNGAKEHGGAITNAAGGSVTINDGKIYNNYTTDSGGAISVAGDVDKMAHLIINGGEIYGKYTIDEFGLGGAIYINRYAEININDGKIYSNNAGARGSGGAICFIGANDSVLTLSGANIFGNTAEWGSGIYAADSFILKGAIRFEGINDVYLRRDRNAIIQLDGELTNMKGTSIPVASFSPDHDDVENIVTNVPGEALVVCKDTALATLADTNKWFTPAKYITDRVANVNAILQASVFTPTEAIDNTYLVYGYKQPIITFDANGGSWEDASVIKNVEAPLTLTNIPETPELIGYHFAGWYLDVNDESTQLDHTNLPSITSDVVYYAKWAVNTYKVDFKYMGKVPEGVTEPLSETVEYNSTITKPTVVLLDGWAFDGWYTDENCTNQFDFTTPISSDVILYGKWSQIIPENPTDKPTQDPTDKPEENPTDKPVENPMDKPTDKPMEDLTEKPMDNPQTSPKPVETGDNTQMTFYILFLLSSALMIVTSAYKKRSYR